MYLIQLANNPLKSLKLVELSDAAFPLQKIYTILCVSVQYNKYI